MPPYRIQFEMPKIVEQYVLLLSTKYRDYNKQKKKMSVNVSITVLSIIGLVLGMATYTVR